MISRRSAVKAGMGTFLVATAGFHQLATAQESTPASNVAMGLDSLLQSNVPELPMAEDGVQVVLVGQGGPSSTGVVIHNSTDEEVALDDVSGIARDSEGSLHAVADQSILAPYILDPGGYGLGLISFDKEVSADEEITFEVKTEAIDSSFMVTIDLPVTEISLDGGNVIGIVENDTEFTATALMAVVGIFFDPSGQICGWVRTYLNDGVAPGGIGTFSTSSVEGTTSESYLFAASGWAES